MPVTGLNAERCAQRNRIAATRDGVNAVPFRFNGAGASVATAPDVGPLMSDEEALARINARCATGSTPLTLDQVHIHYADAANSNFIGDRYVFLDSTTLRNIAADAEAGFAFMNSHRTGSLSTDSELPFGRTFCGAYDKGNGITGSEVATIGFYMLAGVYPNGANGPSTDTMSAGIRAGTVFDVSVGLWGGDDICDICGNGLYDVEDGDWLCPHIPGTTRAMTAEQKAAQVARGVPDGCATYTLVNAHCSETSAVYDGAVPGAGFRKFRSLSRSSKLSPEDVAQARHAYARLLSKGDMESMDGNEIVTAIKEGFERMGARLNPNREESAPAATLPVAPPAENPETVAALARAEQALAAQKAEIEQLRQEQADRDKAHQLEKDTAWIDQQVREFRLTPAAADKLRVVATDHPAAFAAMKPGIEENGVIVALGGGTSGDEAAATANTAAGRSEGAKLEQLAKAIQEKEPGTSYTDAFNRACAQNKDLARAYRAAQTEVL